MQASIIVEQLRAHDVTHVVGVPDNGSRGLYEALWADPEIEVIGVTREGEACAVASGLYLGGAKPVVIIQNTGFLETGDALRGTAYNMCVPLVMLIGYRGYMNFGSDRPDTAASFFQPTLQAWDIPHTLLRGDDEAAGQIADAFETATETSRPAAVLLVDSTD
jgi:sulfopyruvate decarboxylase TPP-binding subunit